jgi:hypothetical protein
MRQSRSLVCGAVLGLVAVGASAYGVEPTTVPPLRPESSPPEGTALVCVLRGGGVGAGLTTPVRDNGVLVGATEAQRRAGSMVYVLITSGPPPEVPRVLGAAAQTGRASIR